MAEGNAIRTGKPREAGAPDPFAELAQIIGFDPRVKLLKPGVEAPSGAATRSEPLAGPSSSGQPDAADPATADAATGGPAEADWQAEFADVDFGLSTPDTRPPVQAEARLPEPAATAGPEAPGSGRATERAGGPAGDVGSFEVSGEVDEITQAFEQEWQAKASWSPTRQAATITTLRAENLAGSEEARSGSGSAGEPAGAAAPSSDAELDGLLAASIELELDDDWLDPMEFATPADEAAVGAAHEPTGSAPGGNEAPEAPAETAAPMSFEDELAALLGAGASPSSEPRKVAQRGTALLAKAEAPAPRPVAARAAEAAPPPREGAVEGMEVRPADASAPHSPAARAVAPPAAPFAAPAEVRRAEPARSAAPDPEDDPFAALAAMAARYRAAQHPPEPAPRAEPAAPVAPPVSTRAEAAPNQAPEVEEMKRTSSVRYDTPEIDTVEVPEYPVAVADDLDLPSDPHGFDDEPRAVRTRSNDYDDEFDDLLKEMSAGEPRPAAPRQPPQSRQAPQPRQASPRPAMPRASTFPEQARAPRAAATREPAAFDSDWDDYAAPAQASGEYGFDEAAYDDEPASERAAPAKPERKRGRWFAALFGSVALAAVGGAYALKFTGVAEVGGPVLVKADSAPLKVRPENPGGAVVPNQENQVYDRVAGLGNAAAPQEKLLSSTEEPVSLDEPAEEGSDETLPGLELSGDDMLPGDDMDIQSEGKSEERVDASAPNEPADQAPIAVAPRKVKTMVVKPDGTLAEREDATPAVQALASNAADVLDTVKQNSMAANVDMNDSTASVTPSGDDQPAAGPVAAAASDDPAAQPAVAQPTGEWTVQIASQPSEAAARANYADLARRYADVLTGRPVSIVKADVAGKGTFWRVRVAAEDRSEAASLCTSYKAAGGNCFVTK